MHAVYSLSNGCSDTLSSIHAPASSSVHVTQCHARTCTEDTTRCINLHPHSHFATTNLEAICRTSFRWRPPVDRCRPGPRSRRRIGPPGPSGRRFRLLSGYARARGQVSARRRTFLSPPGTASKRRPPCLRADTRGGLKGNCGYDRGVRSSDRPRDNRTVT